MTHQTKTILVTAAVILKDNKILIAKRASNKHLAGFWEFPGGKVEDGETEEEGLIRELKEELNIDVDVLDFLMENNHNYGHKEILLRAYYCEFITGNIILNDHDDYAWVSKDELGNYKFAPADVPFIKAINAGELI